MVVSYHISGTKFSTLGQWATEIEDICILKAHPLNCPQYFLISHIFMNINENKN